MHKFGKASRAPVLPSNSMSGRTDWYNCLDGSRIRTIVI